MFIGRGSFFPITTRWYLAKYKGVEEGMWGAMHSACGVITKVAGRKKALEATQTWLLGFKVHPNTRERPYWPLCCHGESTTLLPLWKQVGGLRWKASLSVWFYWKTEPHELAVKPCKCWSLPNCLSGKYPKNTGSWRAFQNLIPPKPQNSL